MRISFFLMLLLCGGTAILLTSPPSPLPLREGGVGGVVCSTLLRYFN